MALATGILAPDFSLPSTSGSDFTLSLHQKDRPCILYFYPKDFTGRCTKEACEFRDQFADFRSLDIDVYGISRDSVDTHLKFKAMYKLPFELLADQTGAVARQYDALIPVIGLTKRITYLLDASHCIVAVYAGMFAAEEHVQAMLEKLRKNVT